MARLTRVGVGGFKSIKDLQPLALRPVNVFVGANGAGKSNLISYFRFLNAISTARLQEFVGRAGGANAVLHYGSKTTPALWTSLEFESEAGRRTYFSWLLSTETDSLMFSNEQVDDPTRRVLGSGHRESLLTTDKSSDLMELLAGIRAFHFEDTSETAAIRRRGNIEDNRGLHTGAGNLAAFLYGLRKTQPHYYQRIVTTIRQIAPFFEDFDLAPMRLDPNSILLNWRDRDSEYLFGPHQLSDGTLRTMALVSLLAQPESDLPSIIVIDEPEIGLHPYALEIVAELIKSASAHSTIIIATQSVGLVNQFAPEDIITVTRDKAESRFESQNSETLAAWLEDYAIGEIWERNLIGGTPSR
ncbi:MAG: AAA family ATPase [Bryobacteraceae bacterium]|jgi:predicted ATPase